MPKLTLDAVRDIQASFKGRITSAHDAQTEFPGATTVLIPESVKDIERGLQLAQASNRLLFVRSGRSISAADVTDPAAAVLSLETFRDVKVSKGRISVGAATTTADVADRLRNKNLFLPLVDNGTQTIVSAVLRKARPAFLRSRRTVDALRDSVFEAEVVPTDGVGAGRARTVRNKALRDVLDGHRPAVITRLVLDADAAKGGESARWTLIWTVAYKPKALAALCGALFGADTRNIPKRNDLSVRVTSAAYSMKLVIVRATGHGETAPLETYVQAAFRKAKVRVLESTQEHGPGSSVAAWVATGPGEAASDEIVSRFGSDSAPRPFRSFRAPFLRAVEFAVDATARGDRGRAPGVRGWAELQLAPGTNVVARAAIIDAGADPRIAKEALARTAAAIPADSPSPIAARGPLPHRGRARVALRGVAALPRLDPTRGFDLVPSNRTGDARIPGFKGDVFDKSDGKSFSKAIDQYAVSSYSREEVRARMTPRFVAVPQDAEDVVRAVPFASHQGLSVVARSGGHQYCGLSSGGGQTLLIDMRRFRKLEFSGTQSACDAPAQLVAGPGVQLKDASSALRAQGVAIPHGECPRVNLGGHVQSGGIGHTLRSLGATLDWVRSFKMVTRDPASPTGSDVYAEREFTRPSATGATPPTDADVFAAVLGGGPSSWGVLTEVTFDLVADCEHSGSGGYSYAYPYVWGQTKSGFRTAMEQFQKWAIRESNGTLPKGIDLFLSVISGDTPRPPVLLVETMSATKAGLAEIKKVVDTIDEAVPFWIRGVAHTFTSVNGRSPLSVIAAEGVRQIGMTGLPQSGREFDLPYKKSVYVTKAPFSDLFLDRFVELVDDVYNSNGVKVVFQGAIGGGRYGANGQNGTTHMQRRDALVQLVFDVFYEARFKSKADDFQKSMKALLGEYSGGTDLRMLWGSFEDEGTNGLQLDMSIPATRRLYYDSPAEYARLRRIKKYTDPKDLFRTPFTVGLP